MTDFFDPLKIPIYPRVNRTPRPPTETRAANATYLLERWNQLMGVLDSTIGQMDAQIAALNARVRALETAGLEDILFEGGIYSQSSTWPGFAATLIGMTDEPAWNSGGATNTGSEEWIQLDLGQNYDISGVRVGGGVIAGWGTFAYYLNGANIQTATSEGPATWVTRGVISGVSDSGPDQFKDFKFPPVSARYVRIQATNTYVSATEFRAYIKNV